jgi:hypothetical protein
LVYIQTKRALTSWTVGRNRLVILVSMPYKSQELPPIEKDPAGIYNTRDILKIAFEPITGGPDEGKNNH